MAYLTVEELKTHLREEMVDTITRRDDTIVVAAIDAAVEEARGYLTRFDTTRIFSASGSKRNQLLLIFVKDIAVWHLLNLCNAGTDHDLRENRYNRAVDWLKAVQKGNASPDLPEKETDGTPGANPVGQIIYGSNPKRIQHF